MQHTQEVNHNEEAGAQHGSEPGRAPNVAVKENARRNRGIFLLPPLDGDEANDQNGGEDEQGNDTATLPGISATTPL